MPNMVTVGQRNLKLLGGQGKTDGQLDRKADSTNYPPYNFVVRGYTVNNTNKVVVDNLETYLLLYSISKLGTYHNFMIC
jgi:hypothetical protein